MSNLAASAPRIGETYLVMADLIHFRVTTADSPSGLCVVEVEIPVGGGPPPLHVHPPDEVFHVIEGEVVLYKGPPASATRATLRAGESEHVPGGTPHTFRNYSDKPARMLLVFSPGEIMEQFFVGAGHPVTDRGNLPRLDLESEVPRAFEVGRRLGVETLTVPER